MAFLDAFCRQNTKFNMVFAEFSVREPFKSLTNPNNYIVFWGGMKLKSFDYAKIW